MVLGGDCSVLIGEALALRRRGRYGLAFVDGHGDFRHQGNGELIAAAGEDLAIVTGRGDSRLVDLGSHGPSVRDEDVIVIGVRPDDVFLDELSGLGMPIWTSDRIDDLGIEAILADTAAHLTWPALEATGSTLTWTSLMRR